jgi:N-methylhydantoinase B
MNELQVQLAWNRLLAIVEEQAQVLMRTAFSTVVREAGDLSAGVFNLSGEMLAQAVTGTPGHVNSMGDAVGKFLARYPLDVMVPGDVLVTNDPWDGTGHLNDFTVVTPVFRDDRCVALFASTSHIADVGGRGFGPDANDLFEEGIRIPISYLFRAGQRNETLMEILTTNVRDPVVAEGDLYSLTACNDAGAVQLLDMLDDLELVDLQALGEVILERSRNAMVAKIAELEPGEYAYQMTIDGYDEPVELCARVTITAHCIEVDFSGTSSVSAKGINVPLSYTQAYASFGVRCLVGNEVPNNAGSLSVIAVSAPEGCLVNALPPRAVSARHAIGQMLPDVVLGCLHQALPNEVPAEGASCIWNPVFMSTLQTQGNNASASQFVINPIFNGGTGARPHKDGLSTTAFPSGVRTTSTEVNEATSPLVFWRKEYTPNSGGAGHLRGGLGQTIELSHRYDEEFVVSKMFDRIHYPARGRAGGGDGQPGRVYIVNDQDGQIDLPGKGRDVIPGGARLIMQTPGGGGMGDPQKREPAKLEADQRAGLISTD